MIFYPQLAVMLTSLFLPVWCVENAMGRLFFFLDQSETDKTHLVSKSFPLLQKIHSAKNPEEAAFKANGETFKEIVLKENARFSNVAFPSFPFGFLLQISPPSFFTHTIIISLN